MDPDSEIRVDFPPYLRIYKSGRLERLIGTDTVPAGLDSATGVNSKDIVIDAATGVSVRLYLPDLTADKTEQEKKKMPVLVYYHGGGFLLQSAASPTYHSYLNSLVAKARVLAVSVDYRLAPEHPLPAGYDDSWDALKWPWLAEHSDMGRIFLAGDSAGANIVHNTAVTAALRGLGAGSGAQIEGIILIHAYFWGKEPLRGKMEKMWEYVFAGTSTTEGTDDPRINPVAAGNAARLRELPCKKAMVCVAEHDFFSERAKAYYEAVKKSGWGGRAELLETEGEEHVFFLKDPRSEKALAMMDRMIKFFGSD
ncbi:Tuliposide A-converting enzyme 2, chloroplastic [Ananas comosus]|uniref:Tuliposide A-converting enzyme 2, chloroplastic n=1 Tax=Ananas comosus TaxID=4615 RepID=A0A199VYB0_ANACO|nr:Tuliposide A-converting enzyme 2, chloroplastic [Ananas comosus]